MAIEYVLLVEFTAGLILNALEIFFLLREKKIKEPFKMTILSLAFADLITSGFLFVSAIIFLITGAHDHTTLLAIFSSTTCSQFHIVFITMQRFIAVIYPLKLKSWITSFRSIIILILIWLISMLLTLILYLCAGMDGPFVLAWIILTGGGVLLVSYSFIVYRSFKQRKIVASNNSSSQNLRLILYSLTVTVAFIACNYPWAVSLHAKGLPNSSQIELDVHLLLLWLNLSLDPIIYFLFNACKSSNGSLCCIKQISVSSCISGGMAQNS